MKPSKPFPSRRGGKPARDAGPSKHADRWSSEGKSPRVAGGRIEDKPKDGAARRIEARERAKARFEKSDRHPRAPRDEIERRGEERSRAERPRENRPSHREPQTSGLWIYGKHAALAALQNPKRVIKRGFVSESVASWLAQIHAVSDRAAIVRQVESNEIGRFLHEGAVHQGIALEVEELPRTRLGDACALDGSNRPVVVLDQITDPHNIGAVIRSAVAFGARAVIVQDRRTPPLAGALAKAAAGAVELLPCVEVVNVARSLEGLKALGYHCAGLTGDAPSDLSELPTGRPIALVLGSEGEGLRQLVASTCDALYRIPVDRRIESLNVSNAAAIALYEAKRRSES